MIDDNDMRTCSACIEIAKEHPGKEVREYAMADTECQRFYFPHGARYHDYCRLHAPRLVRQDKYL